MITDGEWDQALIFIETKHGAAKLVAQLEKRGIKLKLSTVDVAKRFIEKDSG